MGGCLSGGKDEAVKQPPAAKAAEPQKPSETKAAAPAPANQAAPPVRPKVTITAKDQAVLDVKNGRDQLEQYRKRTDAAIEMQNQVARQLVQEGKLDRAKMALEMKQLLQTKVNRADKQLRNVEKLLAEMESTALSKEIIESMEQGNIVLKELAKDLSVERVDRLLQDTEEQVQIQREIADRLAANPMSEVEKQELEQELESMMHTAAPAVPVETETTAVSSEQAAFPPDEQVEALVSRAKTKQKTAAPVPA